ncbi:hypothetical protein KIW84_031213 [Lathyrus oleraceus]|uniref:Reverse transcriptase/retrotransposon-derived protein RNase H-like domain-containing protein n=1 Tax=Pisum sativum TaxID=3888 RepID=A0A9D4XUQ4_PEA|nr:hypothetical protein KIW84_031213 [Pisum sativum]
MLEPRTEKQVRGFLGRLNYIARFISHLTATCEPIFKLLRKDQAIRWNDDCQRAFEKIKEYLHNPSILMPPVPGRPLIMYLTVLDNSMGCVLSQHNETVKYIFEKPALTGRVARWQMVLTEYDIQYTSQKAIKGSILSDYLAQ